MTMPIRLALGQGIGLGIRTKLHDHAHPSSAVVLNLGSIEPQGFGESVSGVRRFGSPHSYDS